MLSKTIEKTAATLQELHAEGEVMDLDGQTALIKVLQHWQALAIGLECAVPRTAPIGTPNWAPKLVAGTSVECTHCVPSKTEIIAHVLT